MRTKIGTRALAHKLAGHLAIGAGIGATLAMALLCRDLDFYRIMMYGSEPDATAFVVVGSLLSMCAVAAALTGFIFMMSNEDN